MKPITVVEKDTRGVIICGGVEYYLEAKEYTSDEITQMLLIIERTQKLKDL